MKSHYLGLIILYLAKISAKQLINYINHNPQHDSIGSRRTERDYADEAIVDLSNFILKFEECQFVKEYSDDIAVSNEYDTVLTTQKFIIFRLCPKDPGCSSCDSRYGEYLVDMDEYLQATLEYYNQAEQYMCEKCRQSCPYYNKNQNHRLINEVNCTSCVHSCYHMKHMEEEGYVDATQFLQCTQVKDYGKNGQSIYLGPTCVDSGKSIQIGVFQDSNCITPIEDENPEEYIPSDGGGTSMKLSYILLKNIFDESSCITCSGTNDNENKVCSELYEEAGKCETKNGFNGITAHSAYYSNQIEQESVICDYINSLKSGTYNQEGEIVIDGTTLFKRLTPSTTFGQKFALTIFFLGSIALIGYAAVLHSELTQNTKVDLASVDATLV